MMTVDLTWRAMLDIGLAAEQLKDWGEANRIWKELSVYDMTIFVKTRKQEYLNCAVADVQRADWCMREFAIQESKWAISKARRRDT